MSEGMTSAAASLRRATTVREVRRAGTRGGRQERRRDGSSWSQAGLRRRGRVGRWGVGPSVERRTTSSGSTTMRWMGRSGSRSRLSSSSAAHRPRAADPRLTLVNVGCIWLASAESSMPTTASCWGIGKPRSRRRDRRRGDQIVRGQHGIKFVARAIEQHPRRLRPRFEGEVVGHDPVAGRGGHPRLPAGRQESSASDLPGVVSSGPLIKPIRRRPRSARCRTATLMPAAEFARTLSSCAFRGRLPITAAGIRGPPSSARSRSIRSGLMIKPSAYPVAGSAAARSRPRSPSRSKRSAPGSRARGPLLHGPQHLHVDVVADVGYGEGQLPGGAQLQRLGPRVRHVREVLRSLGHPLDGPRAG